MIRLQDSFWFSRTISIFLYGACRKPRARNFSVYRAIGNFPYALESRIPKFFVTFFIKYELGGITGILRQQ